MLEETIRYLSNGSKEFETIVLHIDTWSKMAGDKYYKDAKKQAEERLVRLMGLMMELWECLERDLSNQPTVEK